MTKSQHKKYLARLFNLRRDERLAYEMDRELFPVHRSPRKSGTCITGGRISKQALVTALTLVAHL